MIFHICIVLIDMQCSDVPLSLIVHPFPYRFVYGTVAREGAEQRLFHRLIL